MHSVRRFLRTGLRPDGTKAGPDRCVVTLDFANAFNTPTRQAMWEAARGIDELRGIYAVSYEQDAPLHIVGTNVTLLSRSGSRQGAVDGGIFFSLVIRCSRC